MTATEADEAGVAAEAVAEATRLPMRAAEWTAAAALHSGVFTRLQLRAWLRCPTPEADRSEASRIVASLRDLGLVTEAELAGIGKCVHIHAKQVYRALGETDNRNRRRPGREKSIERLLSLDYVLDHPDEAWLPTERAKTQACAAAGIAPEAWPRKVYPGKDGEIATTRHFVEKFPLAIDIPRKRAVAGCVSPGTTTARLSTWLESYGPLLQALGAAGFELTLVHACSRPDLTEAAAKDLQRAAAKLGGGDEDAAALERIRNAIRACTDESLASIGGMERGLETAREIYARREEAGAGEPFRVETQVWTSTRIRSPEGAE